MHKPIPNAPSGLHPYHVSLPNAPLRHRVARVAVAALPVRLDILAEILENEPRAALCRLTVLHHGAKLGAVLQTTRLVIGEVRAQVDRCQPLGRQPLPASTAILAHEAVALEQDEHDANLSTRHAGLVGEIIEVHLLALRNLLESYCNARRFLDVRIFAAEKVRLHAAVLDAIQDSARRRVAIASGAAGFLIVRFNASREV